MVTVGLEWQNNPINGRITASRAKNGPAMCFPHKRRTSTTYSRTECSGMASSIHLEVSEVSGKVSEVSEKSQEVSGIGYSTPNRSAAGVWGFRSPEVTGPLLRGDGDGTNRIV
jgi:hypothetical protein